MRIRFNEEPKIVLEESQNIWFTSDTHWGHDNILKFNPDDNRRARLFSTIEEMNAYMMAEWRRLVKPNDYIFHGGDVSWGTAEKTRDLIHSLPGIKILIQGNHDKRIAKNHAFDQLHKQLNLTVNKQLIILSHYPIQEWECRHYGAWHLHGHCHGRLQSDDKRLDIGIDNHACFSFFSFDEINNIMRTRPSQPERLITQSQYIG